MVLFSSFDSEINVIQNSNGERESPWNMPLFVWMFDVSLEFGVVLKCKFLFHTPIIFWHTVKIFSFMPINFSESNIQLMWYAVISFLKRRYFFALCTGSSKLCRNTRVTLFAKLIVSVDYKNRIIQFSSGLTYFLGVRILSYIYKDSKNLIIKTLKEIVSAKL